MRLFLNIFCTVLALGLSTGAAVSDDAPSVFQSARIERATLTPSDVGGVSILRLFITNESVNQLTIMSVKGPSHGQSKIMVQVNTATYAGLDSIPLINEEVLDMTSSHMIVELSDLKTAIRLDEKIHLKLILANGELPFTAHVRKL